MKKLLFILPILLLNITTAWAQFPPPTGPIADFVEITGTAEVGETLSGTYIYNDPDGLPEDGTAYQWYRLDSEFDPPVPIDGATAETYTLVAGDAGKLIVFEVTPSNGTDAGMPTPSLPIGPIVGSGSGGNTAPVASNVTFSGTLEVGSTLTGSYNYSDADSDLESGSLYTWYRSDDAAGTGKTPIPVADAATYTLVSADEGRYISFSVIPSDGTDAGTQVESPFQGPIVVINVNDAPTGSVLITGTAQEDEILTASNTLADTDGLGTITYQWQRGGVDITGATNSTYTLIQGDVGAVITVVASYTDGEGTAESVASAGTVAVEEVLDPLTAFSTTWRTTTTNESITLYTTGGVNISDFDASIDWGDGTIEQITGDDPDPSHQYATSGDYEVRVYGVYPNMDMTNGADLVTYGNTPTLPANSAKLIAINQWGNIAWEKMENMFYQTPNLVTYSAPDVPDLSMVSSVEGMFAFTGLTTSDLSGWDVSSITDFSSMFSNALSFNGDLSGWTFSSATFSSATALNFTGMFNLASSFTGTGLASWDVSNADSMTVMFSDAAAFNQDLSGWDISNVTDMFLFAEGTSLSTVNYTNMLSAWGALTLQNGVDFSVGTTLYNLAGLEGRSALENTYAWTITDGGLTAGALSLSTTETSPIDTSVTDTLWMALTIDGSIATDAINPIWALTPATGLTAPGAPVYDETRQQWGYDLSEITVSELDQPYALDISASVSLENGASSIDDNFSINIEIANKAPFLLSAIEDFSVSEDAADTTFDLTSVFSDVEQSASDLIFSIESNTNTALVNASIDNTSDELVLSLVPDSSGSANITIRATDATGLFVDNIFTKTVDPVNDAPIVTNAAIVGTPKVGETLAATYYYVDVENDTNAGANFQWYRASDEAGTGEEAINGATDSTYTVQPDDLFKYLKVTVIPNDGFADGQAVSSTYILSSPFEGGTGVSEDPYLISTVTQLDSMRSNLTAHYKLTNDIDLNVTPYNTGKGWIPIAQSELSESFIGHFDGDNHTISGLYINNNDALYMGFFGFFTGGSVKNVKFSDVNLSSSRIIGTVGYVSGATVTNVHVTGSIQGGNAGGIAGSVWNNGTITESSFIGSISGTNAGGIAGDIESEETGGENTTISNSYSLGTISGTNSGGIVGSSNNDGMGSTITNSYSLATITGSSTAGEIVGNRASTVDIKTSYFAGSLSEINTNSLWNDSGVRIADRTETQMRDSLGFAANSFDFENTWAIVTGDSVSYPYLQTNPQNPKPGIEKFNNPPVAINVAIEGAAKIGEELTTIYTYTDADGDANAGANFQWYRAVDTTATATSIVGATDSLYTVSSEDVGLYVKVEVTPNDGFDFGTTESSNYFTINTAPTTIAEIDQIVIASNTSALNLTSFFDDAETASGLLIYTVTNDNNSLVTTTTDGTVLNLDYLDGQFGTVNVTVTASDGEQSVDWTFTVTVDPPNNVPVFTAGANQTVDENAGAQTVSGWATSISAGATTEDGQVLTFNISTDNNALFSVGPAIDPATGDLSFTPAADVFGEATVTISLSDDGGIANGGVDTSAEQTFTITVEEVLIVNPATAFSTTWQTTTSDETITIYTGGGPDISDYDAIIDWGDGTVEQITGDDPDPSHVYSSAGTHTILIGGTFPHVSNDPGFGIDFDQNIIDNVKKLTAINQWGDIEWESMENMFYEASNLVTYNATDTPDLSQATTLEGMFAFTGLTNADLSGWDVSTITNFSAMFTNATAFNGDVSGWTFSSAAFSEATALNFTGMFNLATSFTGTGVDGWDVSNADSLTVMFADASAFNQDLSGWDVSNVTDMFLMADGAGLSTTNYTAMLSSWSVLSVQDNVDLGVGETTYTLAGLEGRETLINTYGWDITDGGLTAGALSLSTAETSPIDTTVTDTLWMDLAIDGTVATDALSPVWTLTPAAGMTSAGTPVYDGTRQQWGYDLSGISVSELEQEYSLNVFASVPLENGTSSIDDNFTINITVPNTAPIVDNTIGDFSIDEDATLDAVDLTIIFSDAEDNDADLTYSVSNSNPAILSASIDPDNKLELTLVPDSSGTAELTIQAEDSKGLTAQNTFTLTINPINDAPTVANPIADVSVDENAADTTIDLSSNFSDVETASGSLTYTVESNDNIILVATNMIGSTLTLDYQTDQFGVANITVRASDGEFSVDESFILTVNEVNNKPVFASSYDVSTASYSREFRVADQKLRPRDVIFNRDGTKMFIVEDQVGRVVEYTLGTAYNITTAVFTSDFRVIDQEWSPMGVTFNDDGTKMFIVGLTDDAVMEYTLEKAYDITTAVYKSEVSVSNHETFPHDVTFNGDGTKMFIVGSGRDAVIVYTLETAYDVLTAVYTSEFSLADQEQAPQGVAFNGDGTKMFIVGTDRGAVMVYTLETAYDVLTAVYTSEFSVADQEQAPQSVAFNGDGTKMFIVGYGAGAVVEYTLASGTPRSAKFTENGVGTVIDVNANDGNGGATDVGLTYSISGGADGSLFAVDASTGILTFKTAPDFEDPADADGDNVYEVIVQADDGEVVNNTATITLTVTVTNKNDAPVVSNSLSDLVVDETDPNTTINLNSVFTDPEGNSTLTYSAESSNPASVVAIASGDSTLILSYKEFGSAIITVTADDGEFSVADTFLVTVNEVLSVDPETAFITKWQTTTADETVTIPTSGGAEITDFDFIVDWGDGTLERITGEDPDPSHTYADTGTHTIQIEGVLPYLQAGADGDLNQLISLDQWGGVEWQSMNNSFAWARNMEYKATDTPDLTSVTSTAGMFFAAEKLNGDFSSWNTSAVTDMSFMFDGAIIFNGDISTWDVSKVTNMREMFQNADSLNQDLSNWNVSSVTNMQGLFQNASSFNGDVSTWVTSSATNMFGLFAGATSFNQDVSEWDVSNVTDFGGMFLNAAAFDQDISNWDISSAARLDNNQYGFLQGSNISMQNYDLLLNKWSKLANVPTGLTLNVGDTKYGAGERYKLNLINLHDWTFTDGGFYKTFSTRWDITESNPTITIPVAGGEELSDYDFTIDWGDGTLERYTGDSPTISHTYSGTEATAIAISGSFPAMNAETNGLSMPQLTEVVRWGDIDWESMAYMFTNAMDLEITAQDTPNLEGVSSMEGMFITFGTSNFNSDISNWDVSNVTNMKFLFAGTDAFNQDISSWDVSSVTSMESMFTQAVSFDQNLGDWDIQKVEIFDGESDGLGFMEGSGLSVSNYDSTLMGWAVKDPIRSGIEVSFGDTYYSSAGQAPRKVLTDAGWTINDGGKLQTFTTRWVTTSVDETVTIPTAGGSEITDFDFVVDWGDGTIEEITGDDPDPSHTYVEADTHSVSITGLFPHFSPSQDGDLDQLASLEEWGEIKWESMNRMFAWARNMKYNATDIPDLSNVTDMSAMFFAAEKVNANLDGWDVSTVENMSYMFDGAISFNGNIAPWDVSNVTTMREMFQNADSLNQDLNNWNVSSVTDMFGMFSLTDKFNLELSKWDVSNVTLMNGMFYNAASFDQNLGPWQVQNVTNFDNGNSGFLEGSAVSQENYDSLLINWAKLTLTAEKITLDAGDATYSIFASQSRQNLEDSGFEITDGGLSLGELALVASKTELGVSDDSLRLDLTINGNAVPLDLVGVSWAAFEEGSGEPVEGFNPPVYRENTEYWSLDIESIKNANPGGINFTIRSQTTIPSISEPYLRTVDIELDLPLFSLAENGITVLGPYATPGDTGSVIIDGEKILFTMRDRAGIESLLEEDENNPELATTVTTGITDMSSLFLEKSEFNLDISSWDVSLVVNMESMFEGATKFNQLIDDWDVSSVTNMHRMFSNTGDFDQPIGDWNVGNLTDASAMFYKAGSFNQPVGTWDVSSVTNMSQMFASSSYNHPLKDWDVSSVENMQFIFSGNTTFDQPIGDWVVSSVTTMKGMFELASEFNQPIGNWVVSSITDMSHMFNAAQAFNQDITKWDVSSVTTMESMFRRAKNFNQPIGSWTVSSLTTTKLMFQEASKFNQPLGDWNVSNVKTTYGMFWSNNFNHPIGDWDVSSVTDFSYMFYGNRVFNQELESWDVSSAEKLNHMFFAASSFNKPINSWNVSKVTTTAFMFAATGRVNIRYTPNQFNQPLNQWDVSKVTDMSFMFASSLFNQDLRLWNMESVTSTNAMFVNATRFNNGFAPRAKVPNGKEMQFELNWNMSNVSSMGAMFQGAAAFNQDISSWDIKNVKRFDVAPKEAITNVESVDITAPTDDEKTKQGVQKSGELAISNMTAVVSDSITGFLVGSGMSSSNASKMFVEWAKQDLQDGVSINIGSIELNDEGANAMKAMRQANNMSVAWGGQEGVDDAPVLSLPNPYEIRTEDTRILKLWDYVSDIATPNNQLEFKFGVVSDSTETVDFNTSNGELEITARAEADTFFVAIQVANSENIVSLDTLEVRTNPNFTTSVEMIAELPASVELKQNYPNPFNPSTIIKYGVPQVGTVRLEVFDLLGRRVATLVDNERKNAGWHQVNFDASNLASGVYLYRIVTGNHVKVHRMTLIK